MIIKSLFIKNFKNIKELNLDFSNLNLIFGEPGSGKTAIIEAICFLLTDYLKEKISDYVRWNAKKFELHLIADFYGTAIDYYIEGEKGTKRTLEINGEIFNNNDAVLKMRELINPDIALYSNISMQGKGTQLLFEKPTARLEKLKTIFGIDSIVKSVEKMKEDISNNKNDIQIMEAELEILKNKKFQYLEEILLEDLNLKLIDLPEYNENEHEKLKGSIVGIDRLIAEFNNTIINYQKEKNNKDKLLQEIELLENSKGNYPIKRLVEMDTTELDVLTCNINESKIKKAELEKQYTLCISGKCPTCGQDYKADSHQIKSELDKCIESIDQYTILYIDLKNKITEYEKNKKTNEMNKLQIANIEENIINKKEKIKDIENDLGNLLPTESRIIELQNEKIKLNTDLIKMEELKKQYNNIKIQNNEIEKKILLQEQKKKEQQRVKEFNQKIKEEEKKNGSDIINKENDIQKLKSENSLLETCKKILDKDFSSYLIDTDTEFIKLKMNEIFARSYGRYNITLNKDNKGIDFYYSENNGPVAPVGMASGFEEQNLATSFRIALSSLQNLSVFLFDEIDSFASENDSLTLFNVILSELSTFQLFIISHKEQTKEYLTNLQNCNVFEMKNGELIN
jgi:DNA repair exonuclease SbcCD ATPase subunit